MKSVIKNYLSVTKKEWNGLVVLMALIVLVLAAPYAYQFIHKNRALNLKGFDAAAKQLKNAGITFNDTLQHTNVTLFSFNPNHLPVLQWQKLGLSTHQINIIKNYEAKGGRFYTKQDLQKIYSISAADYQRLEPYIDLPARSNNELKTFTVVELNTADEKTLTGINGIGSSLAKRVIRYRDRLGGFYRKEQLKEVWGLDSMMYQDIEKQVKADPARIKKIDINKATLNNLMVFPYLSYKQKNAIIEYRNQHGNYSGLSDLLNIPIIDDGILRKIEPYINFR